MIRLAAAVCGLLLVTFGTAATAELYRWVDKDGSVQFSQVPPPNRAVERLDPRLPPLGDTTAASGEPRSDAPASPEEKGNEDENELARLTRVYRQNCETARRNLEIYRSAARIAENGEPRALSDEERRQRIEESERQIEKYCVKGD